MYVLACKRKTLGSTGGGFAGKNKGKKVSLSAGGVKIINDFSNVALVINVFYTVSYVTSMFCKINRFWLSWLRFIDTF